MKILLPILILFLSACVYGPKAERKSPLNYLSGEHYEDEYKDLNLLAEKI